jgi:hypothetical protein
MEDKMKRIIGLLCCMVFCSTAAANLSGSDDFNDNVMDPAKWSVLFGDALNETNGRLEYSGGSGETGAAWIWELNQGSYAQDWIAALSLFNSIGETALSNQEVSMGFVAFNGSPSDNLFSIALSIGDDAGGSNPYRLISTQAEVGNVQVLDHEAATTADALRLQIAFNASTKVLTSYYDSGDGLTVLTNYSIGSWGMTDSDVFTIALYGDSIDVTPISGEVYGDDFAVIPEPGTLALLGVALGGMLLARRRDRKNGITHTGL